MSDVTDFNAKKTHNFWTKLIKNCHSGYHGGYRGCQSHDQTRIGRGDLCVLSSCHKNISNVDLIRPGLKGPSESGEGGKGSGWETPPHILTLSQFVGGADHATKLVLPPGF